ncbi:laccase-4-like, partial [Diaphorina citri]|uniref:Laccase-4-like n=1 Tax=Diaphorina citri TaxID=121845 RepID=A0A1S3DNF6_DIACI
MDLNVVDRACGSCSQVPDSPQCNNSQCVTADGVERAMLTINRQLPGPSIQVCPGDLIVVDLHNKFFDRAVTIHWHGLYQRTTPFMDGVPSVTQCPISPATSFRYKFPATPFGTFFYHSHQGLQKMDGIVGSLVIRRPRSQDPLTRLYDFDLPSHVILLTDWLHTTTDTRLPGNRCLNYKHLLLGAFIRFFSGRPVGERFDVVVHANQPLGSYWIQMRGLGIDRNLRGRVAITLGLHAGGERFDVVVHANQPLGSYWIQMRGLGLCATKSATYAVLQYERGVGKTSTSALPAATAIQRAV